MSRGDRVVLRTLQALTLALPLARGGNHPWTLSLAAPIVLLLLLYTLVARRHRPAPATPGLAALSAFVALALLTTIPLPPGLFAWLDPTSADLTRTLLPGWPGAGGWSLARALAFDPFAVWTEVVRLGVPMGAFAVVIGYPWASDNDRQNVLTQLVLTVLVGGTVLGAFGVAQLLSGSDDGRASGPFVNPNHFAAWIEMVVPVAVGYLATLVARMGRVLERNLASGRGMGMARHRLWLEAIVAQQGRLWPPLAVAGVTAMMLAAHLATGSRGGTAAVVVGVGITLGGFFHATRTRHGARSRWVAPALMLAALLVGGGLLGRWALHDDGSAEALDIGLGARFAVAQQGAAIVVAHPLFGTGLGSWLAAYRPYQAPPVEYGIWDHAHNDFLELTAETGWLGLLLCLLFVLSVGRALRGPVVAAPPSFADHGFGAAEWWQDLIAGPGLRWGLAGSLAAVLLHSVVDFSLRMPANLLLAALLTGLLLAARERPARQGGYALASLTGLLLIAATPLLANRLLIASGGVPLSARDCLDAADLAWAEGSADTSRTLVRTALDHAPFAREAHQQLVEVSAPGPARDAALERVIALQPWAPEARDALALDRWQRGDTASAVAALEESVARFPYLATHDLLLRNHPHDDTRAQLRLLADGDTVATRMAGLDPRLLDAVERGLRRALTSTIPGQVRAAAADDLVALLEARNDWVEAAATLWAEAEPTAGGATKLARAAQNYLRAGDRASAEGALLAALRQNPDDGNLYRTLAVEVYAALGDFPTADRVLTAGQERAVDMLPVYQGVTDVIARRERARVEQAVVAVEAPVASARGTVVLR